MFRVFGNEGREGIGAEEIDTCLSREGHEMHSWSRTLAAWLPEIRFSRHRYIYMYMYM